MKGRILKSIIFTLAVIAALWGILAYRVRLETWIWHLRHGTTVSFGAYTVPVPRNWHVENAGSGLALLRLDTADHTALRKYKSHAGILLLSGIPRNLDSWVSVETKFGKLGNERKDFSELEDRLVCIGGGKLSTPNLMDLDPDTWTCQSASGLTLIIEGTTPDMEQVWNIVSGIRKKT